MLFTKMQVVQAMCRLCVNNNTVLGTTDSIAFSGIADRNQKPFEWIKMFYLKLHELWSEKDF